MSLFRVPRQRVADAVPVAIVLILLSVAVDVSTAAPATLLYFWFWLRHARGKLRYLIFSCVIGIFLGLAVAAPLIVYHLMSRTDAGYYVSLNHIQMALMVFSTAGIQPIIYRLYSRCSLTASGESSGENKPSEYRGGISDLFALTLLCAIVGFVR